LTLYQANAATLTPLSKEYKILIKNLQECKGYNARQFLTEFMNKGWTKNRLLVKFRTVDRRPCSGRRSAQSTQLSGCCWVRKTNLRAKRNFTWGGGSINHQFCRLFTKFCISSATRKGALNSWLKRTACTLFSACSLRDNNAITSKHSWRLKHTKSILEPSEYYCKISTKSIHIISSYTISKLGRF